MDDADSLFRAWWGYCERWARRQESVHPGTDWESEAARALRGAIRRHRGGPFGGTLDWSLRGARSDALRKRRRRAARLERVGLADVPDPGSGDDIDAVDARDEADRLSGMLRPCERFLFLGLAAGASLRQLAAANGVSRATIAEKIAKVRRRLRAKLGRETED